MILATTHQAASTAPPFPQMHLRIWPAHAGQEMPLQHGASTPRAVPGLHAMLHPALLPCAAASNPPLRARVLPPSCSAPRARTALHASHTTSACPATGEEGQGEAGRHRQQLLPPAKLRTHDISSRLLFPPSSTACDMGYSFKAGKCLPVSRRRLRGLVHGCRRPAPLPLACPPTPPRSPSLSPRAVHRPGCWH